MTLRLCLIGLALAGLSGCASTIYQKDGKTPAARVYWPMQADIQSNGTSYKFGPSPGSVEKAADVVTYAIDKGFGSVIIEKASEVSTKTKE